MAEREGFEPSIRDYRIHTFQACAFNHSATSPKPSRVRALPMFARLRRLNQSIPNRNSAGGEYSPYFPRPEPGGSAPGKTCTFPPGLMSRIRAVPTCSTSSMRITA